MVLEYLVKVPTNYRKSTACGMTKWSAWSFRRPRLLNFKEPGRESAETTVKFRHPLLQDFQNRILIQRMLSILSKYHTLQRHLLAIYSNSQHQSTGVRKCQIHILKPLRPPSHKLLKPNARTRMARLYLSGNGKLAVIPATMSSTAC